MCLSVWSSAFTRPPDPGCAGGFAEARGGTPNVISVQAHYIHFWELRFSFCLTGRKSLMLLLLVRWCNGNTAPFGGVIHGSNPCRTANFAFRTLFQFVQLVFARNILLFGHGTALPYACPVRHYGLRGRGEIGASRSGATVHDVRCSGQLTLLLGHVHK